MRVMNFEFEITYLEGRFTGANFEIMAPNHDEALNMILEALEAAGCQILRRELQVFGPPMPSMKP